MTERSGKHRKKQGLMGENVPDHPLQHMPYIPPVKLTESHVADNPKCEAAIQLIREARVDRLRQPYSNAAVTRIIRALKKLGLSDEERYYVLGYLDILNTLSGEPYDKKIKKVW